MAQKSENYKFEGKYAEFIPTASTAISAGDAVILVNGGLSLATAAKVSYKDFVGICDDDWSSARATQLYGNTSTDYATPTTRPVKLKVYHEGVFDLALRETSGTVGQAVYLLTATTGAQVYTIDPISVVTETVMGPVGFLYETFSGAVANDCQKVRITAGLQNNPRDLRWHLMNRIIHWTSGGGTTACQDNWAQCGAGSAAITVGHLLAMVNGCLVKIESDCEYGIGCYGNDGCGCVVIIWGINSNGSLAIFYDSAKAYKTIASASMVADPFYWPSVTTHYLPLLIGLGASDDSYHCGKYRLMFPSLADCLRVT